MISLKLISTSSNASRLIKREINNYPGSKLLMANSFFQQLAVLVILLLVETTMQSLNIAPTINYNDCSKKFSNMCGTNHLGHVPAITLAYRYR